MSDPETSDDESGDRKWKTTAIVAVIVAVPTSIYSGVQLYDRYLQPSGPRFAVSTSVQESVLPPDPILMKIGIVPGEDHDAIRAVSNVLKLQIMNVGDLPAEEAILHVGDSGFALVQWDGDEIVEGDVHEFKTRFDIGRILSDQSITVSIWAQEGDFFGERSPAILYRGGKYVISTSQISVVLIWACVVAAILVSGALIWVSLSAMAVERKVARSISTELKAAAAKMALAVESTKKTALDD